MSDAPLIHSFHFGDIRESIFSKLEWILQQKKYVQTSSDGSYMYIAAQTRYSNAPDAACNICIVLVNNGVLIHTSFPHQPTWHQRVWMLSGFMGYITYIEVTNPHLRHYLQYDPASPTGNAYEMHATREDITLLEALFTQLISDMKTGQLIALPAIDKSLLPLLPGTSPA
jgi:hypothetical protein